MAKSAREKGRPPVKVNLVSAAARRGLDPKTTKAQTTRVAVIKLTSARVIRWSRRKRGLIKLA